MSKNINTVLSITGILLFFLAHKLLQLEMITDDNYFQLYASGLLMWSIRQRMQKVSSFDAYTGSIIIWLCVFNVLDELLAKNPIKPYKPYIFSILVVISYTIIYVRNARKRKRFKRADI